ncbi:hypothetical protein ACIBCH_20730 [Amycolatopsis thailandensis]|uniref:hypothetical protein n=1 Tax=Amycolatopsis thailandensis TaxID=589330 RepID=UPI0037A01D49
MGQSQDTRSPEERERAAEMDADIIRLRRQRVTFEEIGRLMARKYRGPNEDPEKPYYRQTMHHRYKAALAAIPAREVHAHREELNQLLEELLDRTNAVLRGTHPLVSNGKVMRLGEPILDEHGRPTIAEDAGELLLDDGPILAAAAEMRKLVTEIRQLNGLTVPVKQELEVSGHVNYTLPGVDMEKLR